MLTFHPMPLTMIVVWCFTTRANAMDAPMPTLDRTRADFVAQALATAARLGLAPSYSPARYPASADAVRLAVESLDAHPAYRGIIDAARCLGLPV
jgi:hypothetical protein